MERNTLLAILLACATNLFSQTYTFTAGMGALKVGEYADMETALEDSLNVIALNLSWDYHYCRDKKKYSALPASIKHLRNLKYLNIDFCDLTELPPEIGDLTNLEEISIRRNYLSKLPAEIGKLKKLKYLDLVLNQLNTLPKEIGALTSLETLILGHNPLTGLPNEISHLPNLRFLKLQGLNTNTSEQLTLTYSKVLPNLKSAADSINYLKLEQSQFNWADLFNKLAGIKSLETLDIHACHIQELAPEIGKISSLKQLYLGENAITKLPDEIKALTHLEQLYFSQWGDDYSSWSNVEKRRAKKLLPHCKILLIDYFGPTCGRDKKYRHIIKARRSKK